MNQLINIINSDIFENLPIYHNPYPNALRHSIYDENFKFESLKILFHVSSSKNYEKAVFVCRRLPGYRIGDTDHGPHECCISTYFDMYMYYDAINVLNQLIFRWNHVEIRINNELVTSNDLRDMMWILDQRLKYCPYSLPDIVRYNVQQEYWDIFRKNIF